jgi:hypothetical protein
VKLAEAILHLRHAQKHANAANLALIVQNYGEARQHVLELQPDLEWLDKCLTDDGAAR